MVKKSTSPKSKKKRGVLHYARKYLFFFVVALVFFTGTLVAFKLSSIQPTCANSKSCATDLSEKIENNAVGIFQGKKVTPPKIDSSQVDVHPVLGVTTQREEKHIYVDLAAQRIYAYEGKKLFFTTLVATGKWGKTPTGNFHIWEKLVSTRMSGGEGADAYDLPNVPWVMYFYHDFGLHGAYWHDNFGHTMSHGCVNMRQIDAKTVFEWADGPNGDQLGTAVSICDSITKSMQCIQNNPIN
jgi:lipoprotein-anchoring transpeptidase ErfK/SrfK